MFPNLIVSLISKVAPNLGNALIGPAANAVGSLISSTLGVNMNNTDELIEKIKSDPSVIDKLVALDKGYSDIQNARQYGDREIGIYRLIRPLMAFIAMCTIFVDIYFIEWVTDPLIKQVLVVMLIFLVWDIRQIYRFYFGQSSDESNFFGLRNK